MSRAKARTRVFRAQNMLVQWWFRAHASIVSSTAFDCGPAHDVADAHVTQQVGRVSSK